MRTLLLPLITLVSLAAFDARAATTDADARIKADADAAMTDVDAAADRDALPAPAPGVDTKTEVKASPLGELSGSADLDPAWALYEEAFRAAVRNDLVEAERRLKQIITEFPAHPAAASAQSVLAVVAKAATRKASSTSRPVTDQLYVEETTNLARAEIAIFQTGHGLGLGIEICLVVGCGEPTIWVLTLTAFAGGGLAGSLLLTSDGVTPGTALAINSGTSWGFWNGLAILLITTPGGDNAEKKWGGGLMAAQLAGLGAGIGASYLAEPTAGAISMSNSMGIWSAVLAILVYGMAVDDFSGNAFWGTLLAASDLGLVGGAILSRYYPMSRGRTLIIDAGGIIGILLGVGTNVIIGTSNDDLDQVVGFGIMAASTAGGLALATYLTRNWDVPDVPIHASIAPIADPKTGRIAGATGVLGFAF